MRKSDVQRSYHRGSEGLPMVNVKVWGSLPEADEEYPGCTAAWVDEHLSEAQVSEWWDLACEDGAELAQDDARELFGSHVVAYREGRSGGWLVVSGLPPVDSWDAVMVAKWGKFARWARATADAIPESCLSLIAINVYYAWEAERTAEENDEVAASLPILIGA